VTEYANGTRTFFGPPNATHLWQPVDHNVGARYHFLMAAAYDRWMVSDAATRYIAEGTVPVDVRRKLLTVWAGDAYRHLEVEREKCETARENWLAGDKKDPEPERSLFYKAFARTGNLVTVDGSLDEEIRVDEVEKLFPQFYKKIVKPASVRNDLNKFREEDWVFEFDSDDNLMQYEDDGVAVFSAFESDDDTNDVEQDSEDVDDESGTDQEPIPDNLEVRCGCGARSCKCDRDDESSSEDESVLESAARHWRAKEAKDAELAARRERLKYNWAVPERQLPADSVHDALMVEVNNMAPGAKRKRKQVIPAAFMVQESSEEEEESNAKKRKTTKAAKPKSKTRAKRILN
jgi:hypothetical protein